jgi:hypothetical protein
MAQRVALAAAALNQARVAQVIRHLPLPRKGATEVTARLLAPDNVAQEVVALLMPGQTMAALRAVLAVMAQLGLMVFPMLAVAVAVMVIQALVLVVLAARVEAALVMVTGLQHQQPQVQQTEAAAVAVRVHLVTVLPVVLVL